MFSRILAESPKVVASAAPAKYTVAPFAKPVPSIMIVALPGFAGLGLTEAMTGCGFWRFTVTPASGSGIRVADRRDPTS